MQDYLREIEGTLARKNERKNTLLYKLAKRNAEEERLSRLGVRSLPSNPLEAKDIKVVKYVLSKLKQDIGDKIVRLNNPQLLGIESHGEAVIRAKNDEINHLIARKKLWERRLATLSGTSYKALVSRKAYFGCAKGLPEAQAGMIQDESEHAAKEVDESASDSSCSQYSEDVTSHPCSLYLKQISAHESEDLLRGVEMVAECALRVDYGQDIGGASLKRGRDEDTDYVVDVCIPPEEEFQRRVLDMKKELLEKRIKALRK